MVIQAYKKFVPMTNESERIGHNVMVTLCIRLTPEIADKVKSLSQYRGMSSSCFVRSIVMNALRGIGYLDNNTLIFTPDKATTECNDDRRPMR
jgi:hypothetical protein